MDTIWRVTSYAFAAATAGVIAYVLREITGEASDALPAIYGILAPSAAAFAGLVALTRYHARPNHAFLLLGAGLIAAGILDAAHGLFSFSDFARLAVSRGSIGWTWAAGRLVLATSLLLSVVAHWRAPSERPPFWLRPNIVYGATLVYVVAIILVCVHGSLPSVRRESGLIARPQELVPAALFTLALVGYLHAGRWRRNALDHWIVLSLVVLTSAQVFFMPWSSKRFDALSNGGHFFAFVGYVFLFVGLLVDMHRLFVNAERSAEDLGRANATLAGQIEQRQKAQEELSRLAQTLENRVAERTRELESARLAALNIAEDAHGSRLATERAAAALAESEARIRAIVDTAADGIVALDAAGRIETFNPGAAAIFGYSPDEAVGLNVDALLPGSEVAPSFWRGASASIAHGQETTQDHLGRRKDGSTFPLEVSVASMNISGADRYVAILRDVTQRRRIEQSAREAHAALARKYEEIEEFLSIIAHDLKHPVVGIRGLLTLVKEDGFAVLDPVSRQNIDMCLNECERMRELLSHLAQLGRIEGIKPKLERARLDTLVRGCVDRFRARFQEQGVRVSVEAPALDATIARSHIEEALINLIDNALKYGCPKAGAALDVFCKVDGDRCEISVKDYGAGIDPRFHTRVFQPFRRLATDGPAGGSGIGLTAVQRLMARIGGSVALESQSGHGARFTLRFSLESTEY
ncbi:MAG: PAS domain S-box protein [Planctomycetota bacterium]|nr:PAS domain S-box protein [Planctomycetota bacterium]